MNKKQFIELVQHELSGGNMSPEMIAKYDERVLAKRISNYYDSALLGIWLQMKASGDFSPFDSWSKFYPNVTVQLDSTRNEYYSVLPSTLSAIPVAIRKIRPMKDAVADLIPMSFGANTIFNGLDTGTPERSYYLEGQKVFYINHDGFEYVGMSLVVPFDEYLDDDMLPIPITMKGTLFDLLIQSLRGVQATPIDKINDNA